MEKVYGFLIVLSCHTMPSLRGEPGGDGMVLVWFPATGKVAVGHGLRNMKSISGFPKHPHLWYPRKALPYVKG